MTLEIDYFTLHPREGVFTMFAKPRFQKIKLFRWGYLPCNIQKKK
ncbi:hypothetical protein ABFY48_08450 [Lysinibacillus pakistanensis]